jgi:hypothetical protein
MFAPRTNSVRPHTPPALVGLSIVALALLAGGCAGRYDNKLVDMMAKGKYADAAIHIEKKAPAELSYKVRALNQQQQALLADGRPGEAEPLAIQAFDILRTQGLNPDHNVVASSQIWKGEPFEQAMTFHYIALTEMMLGKWDQARAAASSSLFQLKDFHDNQTTGKDGSFDREKFARLAAAKYQKDKKNDYLDHGYQTVETNFSLGYVMNAIANLGLDRRDEATDNLNAAVQFNPALDVLRDRLLSGDYNTIFVVDYGLAPKKVAFGPYNALAKFVPTWTSDTTPVTVSVNDALASAFPWTSDLNLLAEDHRWTALDDVRMARGHLGDAMIMAGTATAAYGAHRNNDTMTWIGVGIALAGALQRASAAADTSYDEIMPQRTYIAPTRIDSPDSTVQIAVGDSIHAQLVLPGVQPPPAGEKFQVKYVRLAPSTSKSKDLPPEWTTSGQLHYANDASTMLVPGDDLPYILGGRCVRTPSAESLARYQSAGWLQGWTLDDLLNLYREEGIAFDADDPIAHAADRHHVLEGGKMLFTPLPGTAGYARLFAQSHPPYSPKSATAKALATEIKASLASRAAAPASSLARSRDFAQDAVTSR